MTEYSQLAKAEIKEKIMGGRLVLERIFDAYDSQPLICTNCNDMGFLVVQVCAPEIYKYSANPSILLAVDPNNQFHRVIETLTFPCPLCGDHFANLKYLREQSGIEISEHSYRVDFFKDDPGKRPAYQVANDLLATIPHQQGIILFYGGYGVGKTGLLKSIVNQMVLASVQARYLRAAEILTMIRSSYNDRNRVSEDQIINDLVKLPVLAIDEVDVFSDTEWSNSTLRTIIDRRHDRRMVSVTLYATNQQPDQLWPYFASRMQDGLRILVGGKDLRKHEPKPIETTSTDSPWEE